VFVLCVVVVAVIFRVIFGMIDVVDVAVVRRNCCIVIYVSVSVVVELVVIAWCTDAGVCYCSSCYCCLLVLFVLSVMM